MAETNLNWKVLEFSSEDPAYQATQLVQDYSKQLEVDGWSSRKFSDYPQAITIKL
jgi:hypothetical protein